MRCRSGRVWTQAAVREDRRQGSTRCSATSCPSWRHYAPRSKEEVETLITSAFPAVPSTKHRIKLPKTSNLSKHFVAYIEALVGAAPYFRTTDPRMKLDARFAKALSEFNKQDDLRFDQYVCTSSWPGSPGFRQPGGSPPPPTTTTPKGGPDAPARRGGGGSRCRSHCQGAGVDARHLTCHLAAFANPLLVLLPSRCEGACTCGQR